MNKFLSIFENNPYTISLTSPSQERLTSLAISSEALLIASNFNKGNRTLVVVKKNLYQAQRFYSQITQLLKEEKVVFFGVDESLRVEAIAASPEMSATRNESLAKLLYANEKKLVVTHTAAIARHLPLPETYKNNSIHIKVNDESNIRKIKETLVKAGYQVVSKVDQPMTVASRGEIIDVFALNHENPIRIEFFDTMIESIRFFDVVTQRTIEKIDEVYITPASEILFEEEQRDNIIKKIDSLFSKVKGKNEDEYEKLKNNIEEEKDLIRNNISEQRLYKYYGLIEEKASLFEYIDHPYIILSGYDDIVNSYKQLVEETMGYMQELYEDNHSLLILNQFFDIRDIIEKYDNKKIDSFTVKGNYVNSGMYPLVIMSANFIDTMEYIVKKAKTQRVFVCVMQEYERKQVDNYLKEHDMYLHDMSLIDKTNAGVFALPFGFEEGFECQNEDVLIVSSQELFKRRAKIARYANKFKEADVIKNFKELHAGDYVVHEQYGVGQYVGVEIKEIDGIHKDFLKVVYRDNDQLLVPIEQFSLIRKFVGKGGASPKLHKLGTNEWEKAKGRIRERVNDLAERLVNLYAMREEKIGYAFSPDSILQRDFEDAFEYELTRDQAIAIDEIKKDMESPKPMDRLLCGDVGFGKTEVAIRAAFKAVVDSKQVAYLCPTTILSRQHYETFMKRFQDFPVTIAVLNRFVEPKKQKEIIEKVKRHEIDILIGTHRLLSQDVQFADLGLLIIDEEQRFGVEHKEKIKEMKNGIDVLSLSATPIPRTLQMSLVGIRQLSQLDTPPRNRLPVQTYVVEKNDSVVNEIIERELARDGQVFYLFNRVSQIFEVAKKIQKAIPGARVGVAHGKMNREEIEDVMEKFTFNEFNVLVCTTIIETGIDIPNANTMIIEDADRFGLAQLYQIKGRVGRSDRLAYAYLLYRQDKVLNETATKRLQSIKEFTQLGSGYKIAMRDLAIRGAGDMLGPEQAGFIDTVGMDLYIEMLSEAIKKKQDPTYVNEKKEYNRLHVNAYVPNTFEEEDLQKITLYQRIDKANTTHSIEKLKEEIIDRYGKLPKEVSLLFEKKYVEILLNSDIVDSYKETKFGLEYALTKEVSNGIDGVKLFETLNQINKAIKIRYSCGKIIFEIPKSGNMLKYASHILDLVEKGTFNRID